uniref:Uncharacterized protein n=1 Tax=Trichogramma kaykai TaxID=54128 RepID=A0ABD2WFG9_9HYME
MLFVEELKKLHDNQTEDESASRYVEEKLLNIFKKQLSVRFVKNTKVVVPYGYTILENDLPNLSTDNNIRTAALRLREEILNMPVNKLENYAVDNLIKGECDIPSSLNTFLSTLLRGTTTRRNNSDNAKRSISSIAQDIVFSIHQGRVKTSKHITLGLALKTPERIITPYSEKSISDILFSWMLAHYLQLPDTPMWVGFNSKIFDDPNYARYTVKYFDNLIKIDDTHPGLREDLENGSFGIRRTNKPFSRQPIDLTLEQTINADAASKLTGIVNSSNSIASRQRWARNHSLRTKIITFIMNESGLLKKQDITNDLKNHKIAISKAHVEKLLSTIKTTINPFSHELDKNELFHISTGQSASEEISESLLNMPEKGEHLQLKFIKECTNDDKRFELSIPRNTYLNFANLQKIKKQNPKEKELQLQRDLFGQLLRISLEKTLDIDKVLSYPLTPVPLASCHLDGSICKTESDTLMRTFEQAASCATLETVDTIVYDGFFMLHRMKDVPVNFGNKAHNNEDINIKPEQFGWTIDDEMCSFQWFEGDQLPVSIEDITITENEDQIGDTNDEYCIVHLNDDFDEDSNFTLDDMQDDGNFNYV